jgi:two-component system response regulator HydG
MLRMRKEQRVLVVDDVPESLEVVYRTLAPEGYEVRTVPGVSEAIVVLEAGPVDLVITDLKMPKVGGLDLVRYVRENCPDTEVMMITGYGTIEGAVEAVKTGAEEYLLKPFTDQELLDSVGRVLDKLHARRAAHRRRPAATAPSLLGESEPLYQVREAIAKASVTGVTVLITGESGTGKELVARSVHYSSPRASAAFVAVNCPGIPEGLLESELFGHVKGAFTGATETRAGFFQTADGGTIFLDEVGDTSAPMQAKLLRVLEDREVCMVGSSRPRKVDVRILAATNKDLSALVAKGAFREELFYRLNVLTIPLPPLRDRGDDVLLLARHFADQMCAELGRGPLDFADGVLQVLREYHWPGNVRELQNVVHHLAVMCEGDTIRVSDLPSLMRFSVPAARGLGRTLAQVEAEYVQSVLASVGGNKTRAAQILGIDRKTLRRKVQPTPQ